MAQKRNSKRQAQDDESKSSVPALSSSAIVQPIASGAQIVQAFQYYRQLQAALDEAMPDQVMVIRGKHFRKKGYWRAIRTAFNLDVSCMGEVRIEGTTPDGSAPDWGYNVTYKAMAPNGSSAEGDGCCMASEKVNREGDIIATEHNVRSHAHTRAMNRAISNLVGFGEISAEEAGHDDEEFGRRQFGRQGGQQQGGREGSKVYAMTASHDKLQRTITEFIEANGMPKEYFPVILKKCSEFEGNAGRDKLEHLSEKWAQRTLQTFYDEKKVFEQRWKELKDKQAEQQAQ